MARTNCPACGSRNARDHLICAQCRELGVEPGQLFIGDGVNAADRAKVHERKTA